MSTTTRPELSKKNPYWIEKHRYYELKHFCLQYPIWRKALVELDGYPTKAPLSNDSSNTNDQSDSTYRVVEDRIQYLKWIDLIERIAKETARELSPYILQAVTEGLSYDILRIKSAIPCCRDIYYDLYRRFFWLLSRERQ